MSYVDEVLAVVQKKNAEQPEFLQAVTEVLDSLRPVIEANEELYRKNAILERITEPDRQIMFRVPWVDDNGQLRYGYVKDPNDKHKIIVDPEAAEVVKLIFELTAQGKSKTEVANYLNAQDRKSVV